MRPGSPFKCPQRENWPVKSARALGEERNQASEERNRAEDEKVPLPLTCGQTLRLGCLEGKSRPNVTGPISHHPVSVPLPPSAWSAGSSLAHKGHEPSTGSQVRGATTPVMPVPSPAFTWTRAAEAWLHFLVTIPCLRKGQGAVGWAGRGGHWTHRWG